ncbi:MAG: hypothetical protein ACI4I5_07275 [Acutalibacteraceae bacterium]
MKKILCCILVMVLVCLTASCGKTSEQEKPSVPEAQQPTFTNLPATLAKKEAVFVTLSASGAVQSIEVTDRLITDTPQVRVEDITFLENIENVKGPEKAQFDGVNVTWHMQSNQLYYTGKTNKQLPVELHIAYYLNGAPVEIGALRGKAGKVRIEVTAENTQRHGNLYTPFLVVGGAVIENAHTLQVTNGASLGDGNKDIAFGVLLPGMNKSLDFEKELLPERFSISFETDKFSLSDLYFAMVPLSTAKLSEAVSSVFGALNVPQMDFSELLTALKDFGQNGDVQNFLQTAPESVTLFQTAAKAMRSFETVQPLFRVLQKYLTAENAQLLQQTLDSLTATSMQEYLSLLQDPTFIALITDMGAVSAAFTDLIPVITSLLTELNSDEVRASLQALPETMESLQALTAAVEENAQWLNTLTTLSDNGAITQFSTLLQSVQGIVESGALETLNDLSGKAGDLEARLHAVLELGKNYSIFTVAPQDAVTSVYFVFKAEL